MPWTNRKAGLHYMQWLLGKTKCLHFKCAPPFLLLPPTLYWWAWSHRVEYPFGQLESAIPASMLMGWGAEKTCTLCNPCSGITKTSLCYQLLSVQILNTAPYQILWRKLSLSQPKPAQFTGNLYLDSVKNLMKRFTRSWALLVTNIFLWDRAWSLYTSPAPWWSLQPPL